MYKRLSFLEREEISRQLAIGSSIRRIAIVLKRSPSTVVREINSNVVDLRYYRALFGQQRAKNIRRKKRRIRKLDRHIELREIVFGFLREKWSPEQIANRLKILYPDRMDLRISHEAIYSYLYVLPRGELKNQLILALRKHHKARHQKKPRGYSKLGPIQNYLSIEERPPEVADRAIPGHWEGDMLVGKQNMTAIGTLIERTTRMTFLVKLKNLDANTVRKAFEDEFRHLPQGLKRTLTYDQGPEMSEHQIFTKNTKITVYFAHPRSPWERGTNENTNALLRQYFPKGTDLSKYSNTHLKRIQDEFNDRPRKTLGWSTPHEKFAELLR